MASPSSSTGVHPMDLQPEPDLHPLYPNPVDIDVLLSQDSGLDPSQKAELVSHCLTRACLFADLQVLTYLLTDRQAHAYVDLGSQDENGLGLLSQTIHGFGLESERDVEREECVRLLIAQGADVNAADKAGWTALHHAALLAPPTLVTHLMTHGCSLFTVTRRNLTALDIVAAHSIVPGREDIALLLEEAMRSEGWTGGRMEERRRVVEEATKRKGKQKKLRDDVAQVLSLDPRWWGSADSDITDTESDDNDEEDESVYTPPADYSSMLVFSPPTLPTIFESLITNFQPSLRNAQPANTLYMLARFACLTCDHTWLEDLIIGATDAIEETFFGRPDDISCLVFWLYNTTMWLHLMQCDTSINEACEMLGSFELIEEVINSVFVFIIRIAERKVDQLLDGALLDFAPLSSEFEAVQFESEWSFLRTFKKKASNAPSPAASQRNGGPSSPTGNSRPPSPLPSSTSKGFASLRQSFSRARAPSTTTPLQSMFPQAAPGTPSPVDITTYLTALHRLLVVSDINPAFITQLWSQVMYWTSCEIFNRILTRKKYLCRSRAVQISMNLTVLEEWVDQMGLPHGVQSHFAPVRDLLSWLQSLSSISEFSKLVSTVQSLKHINPLQMRRAVRDYRYEINEAKMTDECVQYLTQLQKDWERHRVKLGVEALRKEMGERELEESESSFAAEASISSASISKDESTQAQNNIDLLFDREMELSTWEPTKPPQALGELLDSRYMLPLLLPSDPRLLAALPGKIKTDVQENGRKNSRVHPEASSVSPSTTQSGTMAWRSKNRKIRDVGIDTLKWVDGVRSASRWARPVEPEPDSDGEDGRRSGSGSPHPADGEETALEDAIPTPHNTQFTRKPSVRSRGRPSAGGDVTPIEAA